MLENEIKYYIENQESLLQKYNGKHLVIQNQSIKGVYDSDLTAYLESEKKFEKGTFLIIFCSPGTDSYSNTYYNQRVAFA